MIRGLTVTLLVVLGIAGGLFYLLYLIGGGWMLPLTVYFVGTCLLMTLIILIQKPRGGGLGGAFGGAGGGQQGVFGAKAGDALTLITVSLFLMFLLLGMGLVYATAPSADDNVREPAPAATQPEGQTPPDGEPGEPKPKPSEAEGEQPEAGSKPAGGDAEATGGKPAGDKPAEETKPAEGADAEGGKEGASTDTKPAPAGAGQ